MLNIYFDFIQCLNPTLSPKLQSHPARGMMGQNKTYNFKTVSDKAKQKNWPGAALIAETKKGLFFNTI